MPRLILNCMSLINDTTNNNGAQRKLHYVRSQKIGTCIFFVYLSCGPIEGGWVKGMVTCTMGNGLWSAARILVFTGCGWKHPLAVWESVVWSGIDGWHRAACGGGHGFI